MANQSHDNLAEVIHKLDRYCSVIEDEPAPEPPKPSNATTKEIDGDLEEGNGKFTLVHKTEYSQLVVDTKKIWELPDNTLRIRILNGAKYGEKVCKRIRKAAAIWTEEISLKFKWLDETSSVPAHIRIQLGENFNRSCLGTAALKITDQTKPTMWLSITEQTPKEECRSLVLHEFGHVLGCRHEHQSPKAIIKWNEEKTISAFEKSLGGAQGVRQNILQQDPASENLHATELDRRSIMMYEFARGFAEGFSTTQNLTLSAIDKAWIRKHYPMAIVARQKILMWRVDEEDCILETSSVARKLDVNELPTWTEAYKYATPQPKPTFSIGITSFDTETPTSAVVKCKVKNRIDQDQTTGEEINYGYVVSISTHPQAEVKSASCTWFECPEASQGLIQTDQVTLKEESPDITLDTVMTKAQLVTFPTAFANDQPPMIVLWLNRFTLKNASNPKINIRVASKTEKGFVVEVEANGHTLRSGVGLSWIAYPAGTPRVCSGSLSTRHSHGNLSREGAVLFDTAVKYMREPKVILAFTSFEFEEGKRLSASLKNVKTTTTGFQWVLETQAGTEINGFEAMYIVLGDVGNSDVNTKVQE